MNKTTEQQLDSNLKQQITEPFKIYNIDKDIILLQFKEIPQNINKFSTKNFVFDLVDIDHIRKQVEFKFTKLRPKNKSGLVVLISDYLTHRYNQKYRVIKKNTDIILIPKDKSIDISNKLRQDIAMIFKLRSVKDYDNVLIRQYVDDKFVDVTNRQIIMKQETWKEFIKQISLIRR